VNRSADTIAGLRRCPAIARSSRSSTREEDREPPHEEPQPPDFGRRKGLCSGAERHYPLAAGHVHVHQLDAALAEQARIAAEDLAQPAARVPSADGELNVLRFGPAESVGEEGVGVDDRRDETPILAADRNRNAIHQSCPTLHQLDRAEQHRRAAVDHALNRGQLARYLAVVDSVHLFVALDRIEVDQPVADGDAEIAHVARLVEEVLENRVHLAPVELSRAHHEIALQAAGEEERVVELVREARLQERAEGYQLDFAARFEAVVEDRVADEPDQEEERRAQRRVTPAAPEPAEPLADALWLFRRIHEHESPPVWGRLFAAAAATSPIWRESYRVARRNRSSGP
jgi:hypothetical protein